MSDTLKLVVDKYGLRLNTAKLADVLNTTAGEIRKDIANGHFQIKLYRDKPCAPWYAKAQDVADYLDRDLTPSYSPASPGQDAYNASGKPKRNVHSSKQSQQSKTSPNQTNGRSPHA